MHIVHELRKLHIVIVTAVYPPEPVVSAQMAHDVATFLASDDRNMVTVICPEPSRPISEKFSDYQCDGAPRYFSEGAVKVVRLPSFTAPASRLFPRLLESWSFGRHVSRYLSLKCTPAPDVIYVNSWPVFAQALIVKHACNRDIPVVLQIMDIYPESLCAKLPGLLGRLISFPLLWLDGWIARSAQTVTVISNKMRSQYVTTRRVPSDRVVMIPTWQDDCRYSDLPDRTSSCRKYGVSDQLFTFLYLGNIGPVAGVDVIIRAFHAAKLDSAQLLVVGDGSEKAACMEYVSNNSVDNVHFISDPEVCNVPALQSMAHVCLLPVCKGAGFSSIPSKLSSYMLSAKPVIATVDQHSDTARIIREAGCGWVGDPEDVLWLTHEMENIIGLPVQDLMALGFEGRKYALQHFSKRCGVMKLSTTILSAISRRI